MKNLYLILIALLLINGCKKEQSLDDLEDIYKYLTPEQIAKTPYFTNPAFDTLTFLSNTNDTLIFAKLKADTSYYRYSTRSCPDCPTQDKGTIENRNGVIRLFFPKKTDFNLIEKAEVKRVENEINNRPVRKFGYLTPNEVFLHRR